MPSFGFLVVLLMWLLGVGAPSVILGRRAVSRGTRLSLFALLVSCAVLGVIGWVSFTDPANPDFESASVKIMGLWGFLLYGGVAIFGSAYLLLGLLRRPRGET
jgi:hypothetical protein